MNIGILGGTFNPIHNGHIFLAEESLKQFSLDYVLIMPSPNPPHKHSAGILDSVHRNAMVKLAIQDSSKLVFSDFEMKREGIIYTAETLALLKKQYPENEYYFIIGADSLFAIEMWYLPEQIMSLSHLIAAVRDNQNFDAIKKQAEYLEEKFHTSILLLDSPEIPISSTMIREKVRLGENISDFVPQKVAEYIEEQKLYQ